MSSEQPKLNNSEADNNSTGEQTTSPQQTAAAAQSSPATVAHEADDSDESRASGDVDFNSWTSSNRNKPPSKKVKWSGASSLT